MSRDSKLNHTIGIILFEGNADIHQVSPVRVDPVFLFEESLDMEGMFFYCCISHQSFLLPGKN